MTRYRRQRPPTPPPDPRPPHHAIQDEMRAIADAIADSVAPVVDSDVRRGLDVFEDLARVDSAVYRAVADDVRREQELAQLREEIRAAVLARPDVRAAIEAAEAEQGAVAATERACEIARAATAEELRRRGI